MQLKFYIAFGLFLLSMIVQHHLAEGQEHSDTKSDSTAVQGRRVRRSLILLKTAAVAGVIGMIAGLIIAEKKARGTFFKSSRPFGHFRKRSIGDANGDPVFEYDDDGDDALMRAAEVLDNLGCGGRLLCELHQKKPHELDDTGRKLVQIFNDKQAPTIERLQNDPKSTFQYAAFIGSSSPKDLKACSRVFNRCPYNAETVLQSFYDAKLPDDTAENN